MFERVNVFFLLLSKKSSCLDSSDVFAALSVNLSQDRHGDSCALLNNTLYLCFGQLFNTAESSPWFLVMTDVT